MATETRKSDKRLKSKGTTLHKSIASFEKGMSISLRTKDTSRRRLDLAVILFAIIVADYANPIFAESVMKNLLSKVMVDKFCLS